MEPADAELSADLFDFTLDGDFPGGKTGDSASGYDVTFTEPGFFIATAVMFYDYFGFGRDVLFAIADESGNVPGNAFMLYPEAIDRTVYFNGGDTGSWNQQVYASISFLNGTPTWSLENVRGNSVDNLRITIENDPRTCFLEYDAVAAAGDTLADLICTVDGYSVSIPVTIRVDDSTVPTSMVTGSPYSGTAGTAIHVERPTLLPPGTDLSPDLFEFVLSSAWIGDNITGDSATGYDVTFSQPGYYNAYAQMSYEGIILGENVIFAVADEFGNVPSPVQFNTDSVEVTKYLDWSTSGGQISNVQLTSDVAVLGTAEWRLDILSGSEYIENLRFVSDGYNKYNCNIYYDALLGTGDVLATLTCTLGGFSDSIPVTIHVSDVAVPKSIAYVPPYTETVGIPIHVGRPGLDPAETSLSANFYNFRLGYLPAEVLGDSASGYDITFTEPGYYTTPFYMNYEGMQISQNVLFVIADGDGYIPGDAFTVYPGSVEKTVYYNAGNLGGWQQYVYIGGDIMAMLGGDSVWSLDTITGTSVENLRVTKSNDTWCSIGYDKVLGVGDTTANLLCTIGDFSVTVPVSIHVDGSTVPTSIAPISPYMGKADEIISVARPVLQPEVTGLSHDLFSFVLSGNFPQEPSRNSTGGYDVSFPEPGYYTAQARMYYEGIWLSQNIVFQVTDDAGILPPLVAVVDIKLSDEILAMDLGQNRWLSGSVSPDDASVKALSWISSDESIAKVDQDGMVTGVGLGSTVITATAIDGSGISDSCVVSVYEPIGCTLSLNKLTVDTNLAETITADWAISGAMEPVSVYYHWNIRESNDSSTSISSGDTDAMSGNQSLTPKYGERGSFYLSVSDATGRSRGFTSEEFTISGSPLPMEVNVTMLPESDVNAGSPITASWSIQNAVAPITISDASWHLYINNDYAGRNEAVVTGNSSTFTPVLGTNGFFNIQITDGIGRYLSSSREFTITGTTENPLQFAQPSFEVTHYLNSGSTNSIGRIYLMNDVQSLGWPEWSLTHVSGNAVNGLYISDANTNSCRLYYQNLVGAGTSTYELTCSVGGYTASIPVTVNVSAEAVPQSMETPTQYTLTAGESVHITRPVLPLEGTGFTQEQFSFELNGAFSQKLGSSVDGYTVSFTRPGYYIADVYMTYANIRIYKSVLFTVLDADGAPVGSPVQIDREAIDRTVYLNGGNIGYWNNQVNIRDVSMLDITPVWTLTELSGTSVRNLRIINSGSTWCNVGYDMVLGTGNTTALLTCTVGEYSDSIPVTIRVSGATVPTSMVSGSPYSGKSGEAIHLPRPALLPEGTELAHEPFSFNFGVYNSEYQVDGNSELGYDVTFSQPGYYSAFLQMTYADITLKQNIVFHVADADNNLPPLVPVAGIELSLENFIMDLGENRGLNASIMPAEASVQVLTWTSSDESVAKVDQEGRVTSVGIGSATITATAMDGSGVFDTCSITVFEPIYVTFNVPDEVATGSLITASWEISGGVAPYEVLDAYWNVWEADDSDSDIPEDERNGSASLTPQYGVRGQFNLRVRDNTGREKHFYTQEFTITGSPEPLQVAFAVDDTVAAGSPITASWEISGGVAPYEVLEAYWYVWEADDSNSHIHEDERNGSASLTPQYGVRGRFNLWLRDNTGREKYFYTKEFTITGSPEPLQVAFTVDDTVAAGSPITASWEISGGVAPYEVLDAYWYVWETDDSIIHIPEDERNGNASLTPQYGVRGRLNLRVRDNTGREKYFHTQEFTITGSPEPLSVAVSLPDTVAARNPIIASWIIEGGVDPFVEYGYWQLFEASVFMGSSPAIILGNTCVFTPRYGEMGRLFLSIKDRVTGRVKEVYQYFTITGSPLSMEVNVTMLPSPVNAGETITASWTIVNGADPVQVSSYWQVNDTDGSAYHYNSKAVGSTSSLTPLFGQSGRFVLYVTDGLGRNKRVETPFTIANSPDLFDVAITVPEAVQAGTPFQASWDVTGAVGSYTVESISWTLYDGDEYAGSKAAVVSGNTSTFTALYGTRGSLDLRVKDGTGRSKTFSQGFTISGSPDPLSADITIIPGTAVVGQPVSATWSIGGGYPPYTLRNVYCDILSEFASTYTLYPVVSGNNTTFSLKYGDTGRFYLTVEDDAGRVRNFTKVFAIEGAPLPLSIELEMGTTVEADQPITATWTNGNPDVPIAGVTGYWEVSEPGSTTRRYTAIIDGNSTSLTPTFGTAGTLRLQFRDTLGRQSSVYRQFSISNAGEPLAAAFTLPDTALAGNPIDVQWAISGGAAPYEVLSCTWTTQDAYGNYADQKTSFTNTGSTFTPPVGEEYRVSIRVMDAAGRDSTFTSDWRSIIDAAALEPITAVITLDRTTVAVGEPIRATVTISGGFSPVFDYASWVIVDAGGNETSFYDDERGGTVHFVPQAGVRGHLRISVYDRLLHYGFEFETEEFFIENPLPDPAPLSVELTLDKTFVQAGDLVTAEWTITGGAAPYSVFTYFSSEGRGYGFDNFTMQGSMDRDFFRPTFQGRGSYILELTDSSGRFVYSEQSFIVSGESALAMNASVDFDRSYVNVGETLTATVSVSGGVQPYKVQYTSWNIEDAEGRQYWAEAVPVEGNPLAFTLTPQYGFAARFEVSILDANGNEGYAWSDNEISIRGYTPSGPLGADIRISSSSVAVGQPVTVSWTLSGGNEPYVEWYGWRVSDAGGSNLYFRTPIENSSSTFTPQVGYSGYFEMYVRDAYGRSESFQSPSFSITGAAAAAPIMATITLNKESVSVGGEITAQWFITGGEGPYEVTPLWITQDLSTERSTWTEGTASGNSSSFRPLSGEKGYLQLNIQDSKGRSAYFASMKFRIIGVAVSQITLDQIALTLRTGESAQLTALVSPADAWDQRVNWSTSDPAVAAVSATGFITARAAGTATITVSALDGSGASASFALMVLQHVTGIALDTTSVTLNVGEKHQSIATVLPADASNPSLEWTTSDAAVAAVSQTGEITALSRGTATVTAAATDGSGVTAICAVTVLQPVTGIAVTPETLTLNPGGTATLTATVSPINANDLSILWASDNETVARVSATGDFTAIVTAVSYGSARVTATARDGSGVVGTCLVTVVDPNPMTASLSLDGSYIVGSPITAAFAIAGVTAPYTFSNAQWWVTNDAGVQKTYPVTLPQSTDGSASSVFTPLFGTRGQFSATVLDSLGNERFVFSSFTLTGPAVPFTIGLSLPGTAAANNPISAVYSVLSGGVAPLTVELSRWTVTDSDGSVYLYSTAVSNLSTSLTPKFGISGKYEIRVRDGLGNRATAFATFTITGSPAPLPGTIDFIYPVEVAKAGKPITVSWTAPAGMTPMSCRWVIENPAGTFTTYTAGFTATSSTYTPLDGVSYKLLVRLTDSLGRWKEYPSAVTPMLPAGPDTNPIIGTYALDKTTVTTGSAIKSTLSLSGGNPPYRITKVAWHVLDEAGALIKVFLDDELGGVAYFSPQFGGKGYVVATVSDSIGRLATVTSDEFLIDVPAPDPLGLTLALKLGGAEIQPDQLVQPGEQVQAQWGITGGKQPYTVTLGTVCDSKPISSFTYTMSGSNDFDIFIPEFGTNWTFSLLVRDAAGQEIFREASFLLDSAVGADILGSLTMEHEVITANADNAVAHLTLENAVLTQVLSAKVTIQDAQMTQVTYDALVSPDGMSLSFTPLYGTLGRFDVKIADVLGRTAEFSAEFSIIDNAPADSLQVQFGPFDPETAEIEIGGTIGTITAAWAITGGSGEYSITSAEWVISESNGLERAVTAVVSGDAASGYSSSLTPAFGSSGYLRITAGDTQGRLVKAQSPSFAIINAPPPPDPITADIDLNPVVSMLKTMSLRSFSLFSVLEVEPVVQTQVNVGQVVLATWTVTGGEPPYTVRAYWVTAGTGGSEVSEKVFETHEPSDELSYSCEFTPTGGFKGYLRVVIIDDGGTESVITSEQVSIIQLVTGITLDQTKVMMNVGTKLGLTAKLMPEEPKPTNSSVSWTSSNTEVLTVSKDGTLTALKTGTATVTVTALDKGVVSATCSVTVIQPLKGITISSAPAAMHVGGTFTLSVTADPIDASMKTVTWSSSDPTIVSVDPNTGKLTAHLPGTAVITAVSLEKATITASREVVVTYDLAKMTFGEIPAQAYTGSEVKPDVVIMNGETPLILGTDYTLVYENNINLGNAKITITGTGRYDGIKTLSFEVIKAPGFITNISDIGKIYDGMVVTAPKYDKTGDGEVTITYYPGSDTSVTPLITAPVNAGTYTVKVTLKEGTYFLGAVKSQSFTITPQAVELIWNNAAPRNYDGLASNVTATAAGLVYNDACNVTVAGGNAKDVGDYTATATALSNPNYMLPMTGLEINYTINSPSLSTPTISVVESIDSTSLKITWGAVPLATGYVLERATSATGTYRAVYTGSLTTFTNTGLTAGTVYHYRVRATCTIGVTAYISSTSASKAGVPLPGLSITLTEAVSATSIKVTYSTATGLTGYQVYRSDALAGTYDPMYSGTATTFTDASLVAGRTYYYKVRAYMKIDSSIYYGPFGTTKAAVPLAAPAAPTVSAASGTSVTASWAAVTGATGYQLYRSTSATGTYKRIYSGTERTFIDTGLTAGTVYYYKVRAYASVSGNTTFGLFGAYKAGVPLAVPAISSTAVISSTSLKITWGAVTGVGGYQIYRSTSATGTYTRVYSGTATSYTNSSLTSGTAYYYKARSYKVIGTTTYYGPFSAVKTGVPLAAPAAPTVTVACGTELKVSWAAVTGATGYQLYRSTSATGTFTRVYSGTTRSYTNTGLTAGAAYYYKVRAYASVGGTTSYGLLSAVNPGVPLAAPATLSIAAAGTTSVKASWSAVTGATGYQLYRSTSATGTYTRVYSGTARGYTNTGLTADTTYYYKVRAYKLVGTTTCYGPYSVYKAVKPM